MVDWLAGELCPVELDDSRLRADLLARFREEHVEPPGPTRLDRIVGSARAMFERQFTATITARLSPSTTAALERLIPAVLAEEVSTAGLLVELRRDPGKAGLTRSSRRSTSSWAGSANPYKAWRAYGQSKLADLLLTAELQRRPSCSDA